MHEGLIGDWSVVLTLQDRSTARSVLHLGPSGHYQDTIHHSDGTKAVIRGRWKYDAGQQSILFQPDDEALRQAPPVALGLAACDLRFQPPASSKPGLAARWRVINSSPEGMEIRCTDPPRMFSRTLRYQRWSSAQERETRTAAETLVRWSDASLGELVWDGHSYSCEGRLQLADRTVNLQLWLIKGRPSPEVFADLRALWQGFPEKLNAAEPALRRRTAECLIEMLQEHGAEGEMPTEELVTSLELLHLTLDNDGVADLCYFSPGFFGSQPIHVFCDGELAIQEIELG